MKNKLAENLKIGDICYVIDLDGNVSINTVSNVRITEDKEVCIEYNTGVKGRAYVKHDNSSYGMCAAKAFFSKESAIKHLETKIEYIFNEIEKIKKL